jgi:hypothetical protein
VKDHSLGSDYSVVKGSKCGVLPPLLCNLRESIFSVEMR